MNKKLTKTRNHFSAALIIGSSLLLAACKDDAKTANQNLTKAADNFEIMRNIVFYNTWTDTEVVSVTGFCSIEDQETKLWVTCKDANGVKRHQLGRSANLTYFMTQVEAVDVSLYHTRITWKPQSFIPDIDLRTSGKDLITNHSEANQ
jgi:hypothetical protein